MVSTAIPMESSTKNVEITKGKTYRLKPRYAGDPGARITVLGFERIYGRQWVRAQFHDGGTKPMMVSMDDVEGSECSA